MGWDNAGHAADAHDGWEELLDRDPRVLWGLVADVVKAIKAADGERRTGRRPAVSVASLDELYGLLFPTAYDSRPFSEAFAQLLADGGYSQRTFAAHVGFNQATVSRLLSGKSEPTPEMIERIAYALNVRPTYFAEYRALKLGRVLTDAFMSNPQLSAEAVRRLNGVHA